MPRVARRLPALVGATVIAAMLIADPVAAISSRPTLTVTQACLPTGDPGLFTIRIDGFTSHANLPCGGIAGPFVMAAGTHHVGELAGAGTSLADYDMAAGGGCSTSGWITLKAGQAATCTLTSSRRPTLTITNACVPSNDTGRFNLRIDGRTALAGAACGRSTAAITVTVGKHVVSETAAGGTNLSNYTAVIDGACAADGSIVVGAGQTAVCAITNTRRPTLTIRKVCVPDPDPGHFHILVDGARRGDVSCEKGGNRSIRQIVLGLGTHTLGEAADGKTRLSDYAAAYGGDCAGTPTITLTAGENAACTITNTHTHAVAAATFTVTKRYSDSTTTAVSIGLTCGAGSVVTSPMLAAPGSPAVFSVTGVPAGGTTCSASEESVPADYAESDDCADVALGANGTASCTITNTQTLQGILHNLVVTSSPDTARQAAATIGVLGGAIVATDALGTVYTLRVPPGALAADTLITITPTAASGIDSIATATPFAIEFAPTGLTFAVPATLSIQPGPNSATPDVALDWEAGTPGVSVLPLAPGPAGSLLVEVDHFSAVGAIQATIDAAKDLVAAAIAAAGPAYAQLDADAGRLPGSASSVIGDVEALATTSVGPAVDHAGDDLGHFFIAERLLLDFEVPFNSYPSLGDVVVSSGPPVSTLDDLRIDLETRFHAHAHELLARYVASGSTPCSATVTALGDWIAVPFAIAADLADYWGEARAAVEFCVSAVVQTKTWATVIDSTVEFLPGTLSAAVIAPAGTPGSDGQDAEGRAVFLQPSIYDLDATGAVFRGGGAHLGPTNAQNGVLSFTLDRGTDQSQRAPDVAVAGTVKVTGFWSDASRVAGVDQDVAVHLQAGPADSVKLTFQSPPINVILAPGGTSNLCVVAVDGANRPIDNQVVSLALDGPGSLSAPSGQTDSSGTLCFDYVHPAGPVPQGLTAIIEAHAERGTVTSTDSVTLTPDWAAIAIEAKPTSQPTFTTATNGTVTFNAGDLVQLRITVTGPGATPADPPQPLGGFAQIEIGSGGGSLSDADTSSSTGLLPVLDASGQGDATYDPADSSGATIDVSYPPVGGAIPGVVASVSLELPAVVVSPATTAVLPGQTAQFGATVTGVTNPAVTWTATGGSIDPSGRFTAGSTLGTFTVTATSVEDPSKTGSAAVSVATSVVRLLSVSSSVGASAGDGHDGTNDSHVSLQPDFASGASAAWSGHIELGDGTFCCDANASGDAAVNSSVRVSPGDPTVFSATFAGSADGSAADTVGDGGVELGAGGGGIANSDVTFEVTGAPVSIAIDGTRAVAGSGSASFEVILVRLNPDGTVTDIVRNEEILGGSAPPLAFSGFLAPGRYEFSPEVSAEGSGGGGGSTDASASGSVTLVITR